MDTRAAITRSVVGVFDGQEEAQRVLEQLVAEGIQPGEVSVMIRDTHADEGLRERASGSPVAGGAATGAALGGLLGGLAGWAVAIGAIAIPGVGLVIGAGALAATLAGIALGAATGGLIGALLGLGVPEEEAREYEAHLREGRVLLTVHPGPDFPIERAAGIMEANGGYDVRVYDTPAELVPASDAAIETEEPEGEVSAETGSLGSGAEGGYGDGEGMDMSIEAERQAINAAIEHETTQTFAETDNAPSEATIAETPRPEITTGQPDEGEQKLVDERP